MPTPEPRAIVLVGFSGAGKSTLARRLADLLGWEAIDTDSLVEERVGCSIAELFATRGEAAFRALERRVCAEVAGRERVVVATGGGALLHAETRDRFEERAAVVCLDVSLKTAQQRLAGASDRPLLASSRQASARLYADRRDFYASFERRVDADTNDPAAVAEAVMLACGLAPGDSVRSVQ